jgi:hypothetical protein
LRYGPTALVNEIALRRALVAHALYPKPFSNNFVREYTWLVASFRDKQFVQEMRRAPAVIAHTLERQQELAQRVRCGEGATRTQILILKHLGHLPELVLDEGRLPDRKEILRLLKEALELAEGVDHQELVRLLRLAITESRTKYNPADGIFDGMRAGRGTYFE